MHALFVRTLLVGCPVVIVLGCMCPGPSNNNNNNKFQIPHGLQLDTNVVSPSFTTKLTLFCIDRSYIKYMRVSLPRIGQLR